MFGSVIKRKRTLKLRKEGYSYKRFRLGQKVVFMFCGCKEEGIIVGFDKKDKNRFLLIGILGNTTDKNYFPDEFYVTDYIKNNFEDIYYISENEVMA